MVQGKSPLFSYLISFSFGVFLLHLHKCVDAAALYQQCTVDADCSDASFCDPSYLVCETCIPCENLLNRASGVQSCATSENDCGLCLTGYQSEDLTEQRRSYKCFLIPNKQMEVPSTSSLVFSWNEFITLSAAVIFFASVLVVFATYYLKGPTATIQREPYRDGIRERASLKDGAPPSYSGEVRSSDVTCVFSMPEISDQLNQATPLGHYHTSNEEVDLDLDDLVLNREILSEGDSTMGSTETIPSLWEPFLAPGSEEMPAISQRNHCLIRSQSPITVNVLHDSHSCPNLSTAIHAGIHRHRHIFLSNFRCSTTDRQVAEKEGEYPFEFSEPLPPHSFTFDEVEQPREVSNVSQGRILLRSISSPDDNVGSQDPGYAIPLFASFSRRRHFMDEDTVSNKRRRRE